MIPDPGMAAADEGMQRADEHANPEWKTTAWGVLVELAETRTEFAAHDVWEVLASRGVGTHENRAIGNLFKKASREGLIRKTDRWTNSRLPHQKARPIAVWASAVCKAPEVAA